MIYIYDILLNFMDLKDPCEFYEWDQNDEIEHVKKIPLFRVTKDTMKIVEENDFILSEIVDQIKDRTEIYGRNDIHFIPYACLFSDGRHCIALEFDEEGRSIYKSTLLLDEEEEILDIADRLDIQEFTIEVVKKIKEDDFLTRKEKRIRFFLQHEIEDAYQKNDWNKLQYLYAEYAEEEVKDTNEVYHHLVGSLNQLLNEKHYKLYQLLKLSHSNKK